MCNKFAHYWSLQYISAPPLFQNFRSSPAHTRAISWAKYHLVTVGVSKFLQCAVSFSEHFVTRANRASHGPVNFGRASLFFEVFKQFEPQMFLNCFCFHHISYHRKHVGNPNRVLPAVSSKLSVLNKCTKTQFCDRLFCNIVLCCFVQ